MLTVVVLNFKGSDYMLKCLRSIFKHSPSCGLQVLVVDNDGFENGSMRTLRKEVPDAIYLEMGDNVGFSSANNAAARMAKGDTLLFLNGDTRILQGSLNGMLETLNTDPGIGVLGPRQLDSWGRLQRASGMFPALTEVLFKDLVTFRSLNNPSVLLDRVNEKKRGVEEVDWVLGSCLLIRRQAFLDAGGWDEKFFLYFEDIDLCQRVRKAGWRVCASFDMKTSVINHGGVAAVRNMLRTELEHRRSQIRFIEKHYGGEGLWKLRLVLLIKAAALLPLSGLIFLFSKAASREAKISVGRLLLAKKTIELALNPC